MDGSPAGWQSALYQLGLSAELSAAQGFDVSQTLIGPHPCRNTCNCSQEKALLDQIKGLAKKKEELQIRLEQAQNRMDLAMSIALGSGVQLALLVAPLLVLLSYVIGPHPMGLVFGPGLVLTILLAVIITGQVASDGRTDWLRGVQLLALYLILGAVFFYVPSVSG